MNICIVTVGYNRPTGISRLLSSLLLADYGEDTVDLYVSIDKGARQSEIVTVANVFKWIHGEKYVRAYSERQGLRAHILACGNIVNDYDAIVVLEDDVIVAPGFYQYVKQAIEFYGKEPQIGGISLYAFSICNNSMRPFTPANNGFDAYLLQCAQSWGECWTKEMWNGFYSWYSENRECTWDNDYLPQCYAEWGVDSWLKFYTRYLIESCKYFTYPYYGLSTALAESGEHSGGTDAFITPMLEGTMNYRFPSIEQAVKYDAFYERTNLKLPMQYEGNSVCIDLYGMKRDFGNADILFSTACRPYKIIRTISLKYIPHEFNLVAAPAGDGIFVYDLHNPANPPHTNAEVVRSYDLQTASWKRTIKHGLQGFILAVKRRMLLI